MFLLFKGEEMYFSPQGEKIPKELLRLPPQTPSCCWEAHTHGSKVLQCSQGSHRPPLPVREAPATEKFAPAGAKLPDCTRRPFGVFRRGLRTPAVRKHVPGADETCSWLARTVKRYACSSFDAFLSVKKSMRFSFTKGERNAPSKDGTFFYSFFSDSGASSL